MRKYFNSKEVKHKQLVKDRLRKRMVRRVKRAEILKGLKSEIDRLSVSSKLADALASQVVPSTSEEKFEVSLKEINHKLTELKF